MNNIISLNLMEECISTLPDKEKLDSHQNLFGRIPRLGLPPSLVRNLLYNMSLHAYCTNDSDDDSADTDDNYAN